jgi:hypothetical protein
MFVGKLEGKRSVGRSRRRWEDNITIDPRKKAGDGWTGCIWLRIGNSGGFL